MGPGARRLDGGQRRIEAGRPRHRRLCGGAPAGDNRATGAGRDAGQPAEIQVAPNARRRCGTRSGPSHGTTMKRLAAVVSMLASLGAAQPVAGGEKPLIVELWPGGAPEEPGTIGPEKVVMSPKLDRKQVEVTEPTRMLTNVTRPT